MAAFRNSVEVWLKLCNRRQANRSTPHVVTVNNGVERVNVISLFTNEVRRWKRSHPALQWLHTDERTASVASQPPPRPRPSSIHWWSNRSSSSQNWTCKSFNSVVVPHSAQTAHTAAEHEVYVSGHILSALSISTFSNAGEIYCISEDSWETTHKRI